jgi:hypothetical protein
MNKPVSLILVSILFVLLSRCTQAEALNDLDSEKEISMTIALTKLDVNDQSLELSSKIKNASDHEVWICDRVDFGHRFEVYMAKDDQTLMIRRRFAVPTVLLYYIPPEGQYVRLRPDEERTESLSLMVPVQQDLVFSVGVGTAKYATRVVLEVGFYDEDLPELIRSILEGAEKLGGATTNIGDYDTSLIARYFEGVLIADYFGGLSGFEEYYFKDSSEQLRIPYMHQVLGSEQVLSITIDGVSIPYGTQNSNEQSLQTSSSEPDKPDGFK